MTGVAVGAALLLLAAFVAWTPWRVHGGQYVTEYVVPAVVLVAVAASILVISCWR